ncbi:Response regulator receiver domain-containing protein [Ekhidna lutea]|uniref:Response regulator receiver domain-containing protein n=1 Tax=Ekhidna lutea TaxID=447679 RepID=A0A239MAL5_EKHLU|nr:response regulator [Ekhidna lutea]SNT40017.1 Response regulator receiver domain-containing protein [Ekhidna lutea]
MSEHKPAVIYLDDEEINLLLFREMFKKDFEVYTTTRPEEALEYLKNNDVEFVFTDQRMPVMTGVEFLRELHELKVSVAPKKVMISGHAAEGEVSEAIEKNLIDRFIDKPWTYEGLKSAISTI